MRVSLNRRLHGLLSKHKLTDDKGALVHRFTDGRTTHSREMSIEEMKALIEHIESSVPISIKMKEYEAKRDRKRKHLIAMGHSIGKHTKQVISWCERQGARKVKKKFNEYNLQDLYTLIKIYKEKVAESTIHAITRR